MIEEKVEFDIKDGNKVFKVRDDLKPYVFSNGYECPAYGEIHWKDEVYPVYTDAYGCNDFIVVKPDEQNKLTEDYCITVQNMGGMLDWGYELNRVNYND